MLHDVRETREAIQEIVDDDKALAATCLSEAVERAASASGTYAADNNLPPSIPPTGWGGVGPQHGGLHQTPAMRLAATMLESYERQIQSVEGALKVGVGASRGRGDVRG